MRRVLPFVACISGWWISQMLPATACLWDSETLAQEKARFPETPQILAGNFPRHSQEFYEWRKARCKALLKENPSKIALYDDLAVSQHKLGDHKAAIATMMAKEKIKPGLYETYSNLGTFYIYTGELSKALGWIEKALEINPNAHFGRERYQGWLVEWMLEAKFGAKGGSGENAADQTSFAGFVLGKLSKDGAKDGDETETLRKAVFKGIQGMMLFADYDNPLLQEALGDVLAFGGQRNAAHLAHQAYLMAAAKLPDEGKLRLAAKCSYLEARVEDFKSDGVQLKAEVARGQTLVARIREDEIAWIKAGKDSAAEFDGKYRQPSP